jgi:hypothetical protein
MYGDDPLLGAGQDDVVIAEPDPKQLTWASAVYRLNGVRLISVDGNLAAIGIWSDLDGPHIREAIRIYGNQDLPVRYLDGRDVPMRYKVRNVEGDPVPLSIVKAMDKANAAGEPAWDTRDCMLASIKWRAKLNFFLP